VAFILLHTSSCLPGIRQMVMFCNFCMDNILPTIHGLEVVAAYTSGYASKEHWGKLDLGYILGRIL
jgi:hypothetical protein